MKAKHAAARIKNSNVWYKVFCALMAVTLLLLMVPNGLRAHAEDVVEANNAEKAVIDETQNDDNAEEVTNEDSNEAMVEAEAANTDSVDINEKTIWNFPDCGFSDEQEFRLENLQEATTSDTSITQTQNIDIYGINTASGLDSLMTYYSSENGIDVMDDSASDKYYFKIPAIDGYKISSVSYVASVDMTNVKYSVKIGDTLLGTALNTKTISSTEASLKTYTPTTDLINDLYVYWNQTSTMVTGSVIFQGIGVTYEELPAPGPVIEESTVWDFPSCGFEDGQEFSYTTDQTSTTHDESLDFTENLGITGVDSDMPFSSLMVYYDSEAGIDVSDNSTSSKYYFRIPAHDGYKISSVTFSAGVDEYQGKAWKVMVGSEVGAEAIQTYNVSSEDLSLFTYEFGDLDYADDLYIYWNIDQVTHPSLIFQGIGVTYEEYTPEPVMVTMTNGGGVFPSYLHLSENPDYDWTFDPSTGNYTAEVPYGTLTSVIDRLWRYDYPMKENTLFEGWDNDAVGDKITEETTFTPIWWSDEIVTYKVKFVTEEQNAGNKLYSADEYLISKGSTYAWSTMADGTAYLEFNEGSSALTGPYRVARAVPADDYVASFDLPASGVLDSDLTVYADFDYNGPGVKGVVQDFQGNPLTDVNVDVYNTSGERVAQAVTSSDERHLGEYSIVLEDGFSGTINFYKDHYIPYSEYITIGTEASVINLTLDRLPEVIFHSSSEGHEKFVLDIYSEGQVIETYEDVAADRFLYEDLEMYIDENGVINTEIEMAKNNVENGYTVKAVAKNPYTLASWTVNGVDYEIGKKSDPIVLENNVVYDIQANYTAPAEIVQTGDDSAAPFVVFALIAIVGACGAFFARKYFKKN